MRAHGEDRRSGDGLGGPAGARGKASEHPLLALQRQAGNAAVGRLLSSPRFAGVTRLEACAADRDRLAEGDRGEPVSRVQQGLVDLGRGYDLGRKGADGVYGPKTAGAVRRFKADEDLGSTAHGDMKGKTIRALDKLYTTATGKKPGRATELRGTVTVMNPRDARPVPNQFGSLGFQGEFRVQAEIVPSRRARFAEYRQLIRGFFAAQGKRPGQMIVVDHPMADGSLLSLTEFKEDTDGPGGSHYGHRDRPPNLVDVYEPDRATGVHYHNLDMPGWEFMPGVPVMLGLDFEGILVDTRKDHPGEAEVPIPGAKDEWSIRGSWPPP